MNEIRTANVELINKFKQLEQSYKNWLKNSTSIKFATVPEIQNQQQVNKIKPPESLTSDITTEADRGATGAIKPYVRYAKSNSRFLDDTSFSIFVPIPFYRCK